MVSRRRVLAGLGASGAIALAGCSGNGGGGTAGEPSSDQPFKLGMVTINSGPFGGTGDATIPAAQMAVDRINREDGLNGRTVELLVRDDEASADTGLRRTRQLVTEENIDAMYTATSVAVLSSLRPFLIQQDIPIIDGGSVNMYLTREECRKNYFRIRQNITHRQASGAEITSQLTDGARVAAIEPDYEYGRATWEIFQEELDNRVDGGIEVVSETFPGFGKGEYQTEIQQTLDADPDIVHSSLWVGDLISFIQQAQQFDFYNNIEAQVSIQPMLASHGLGDNMARFIGFDSYYHGAADTELNRWFIDEYTGQTGLRPNTNAGYSFECPWALKKAVDTAGGTTKDDIISGMEGLTFDGLLGEITVREEDHQAIHPGGAYGGWTGPLDDYDSWGIPDPITVPGEDVALEPSCTFESE